MAEAHVASVAETNRYPVPLDRTLCHRAARGVPRHWAARGVPGTQKTPGTTG